MLLTMKEEKRIEVIQMVMDERLEIREAARGLGRSERQVWRMLSKMRAQGLSGLIHGNKGRMSQKRTPEKVKERILKLVKAKYGGINDRHLQEILEREDDIVIGRETLRKMLRGSGIGPKRKRRGVKYRRRRERKEVFGIMIQIDGSPHDWLEGRGSRLTLIGGIDDATSKAWARFEDTETTWGYLELMRGIILKEGTPLSLYSDRHAIFFSPREPSIEEQLKNQKPLTQFGRAMAELGIELIPAYSAPAKGRIERLWGTFQDRLVVELRLRKISTKEAANAVLDELLDAHNQQFNVPAKKAESAFRKSPSATVLDHILCLKEIRVVAKDHTVSFEGLILQIPPSKQFRSLAKRTVEVLQLRDGRIEIVYQKRTVATFSPQAVARLIDQRCCSKTDLKRAA